MGFEYFLFDLDGTLTDPKEGIINCARYALGSFGIDVPDDSELLRFIGPPLAYSFSTFYGFPEEDTVRAIAKFRERFTAGGMFENIPYEGMHTLLGELKKRGGRLAVATCKVEKYAGMILDKFDMSRYFDIVSGAELSGERSEKHEVVEEALRRLGVEDRASCIMIGDRKYDILGAKKCGLKTVGVRYGYAEENELEQCGADYICNNVEELQKLLTSI